MNDEDIVKAPYDQRNAEDYVENTNAIINALDWMKKNVSSLRMRDISIAELSRMTRLHRNTLSKRGQWVNGELSKIKELKNNLSLNNKSHKGDIKGQDKSEVDVLQEKLDLQRKETAKYFHKYEYTKTKLKESENALNKLADKNVTLQKENDDLLGRLSGNVTRLNKEKI